MTNAVNEDILKFLVDYLWGQMSIQSSPFFLPRLLSEQRDSYDPYAIDYWDLKTLPDNNDAVCMRGNDPGTCIGNPTLQLYKVVIKGLYNLQPGATQPVVNNTNVKATMDLCALPYGTPYVTSQYLAVTGEYLYVQKCLDADGVTQYTERGTGTFTTTIFTGQASGDMDIIPDPNDGTKLKVVVNMITVDIPATYSGKLCQAPGAPDGTNICISIEMDSGPDYNFLANQAANYKKVSELLVQKINDQLSDKNTLKDLSDMLTTAVNNAFKHPSFVAVLGNAGQNLI